MDLEAVFERYYDEYIEFERIETKRSQRPDLHAFYLLEELAPGTGDMISAAEHDEFYLDVDIETLAQVITETQVLELVRCGVMYSSDHDCLWMFA